MMNIMGFDEYWWFLVSTDIDDESKCMDLKWKKRSKNSVIGGAN